MLGRLGAGHGAGAGPARPPNRDCCRGAAAVRSAERRPGGTGCREGGARGRGAGARRRAGAGAGRGAWGRGAVALARGCSPVRGIAGESQPPGRCRGGAGGVAGPTGADRAVAVDLILARVVLDGDDAGRYALGAVATKAAFWLPQAVGVVLYPRMAKPAHSARAMRSGARRARRARRGHGRGRRAARPLVPLLVGRTTPPCRAAVAVRARRCVPGACCRARSSPAIARERTRLAAIAWVGLAVEVALILTVADSIGRLIAVAVGCAAASAAAAWVAVLRQPRGLLSNP